MNLDVTLLIDVVLLTSACLAAIFSILPKKFTRALLSFTIMNILIALFFVFKLAYILAFILLWVYAGAVVAFAVAVLNISGISESAGKIHKVAFLMLAFILAIGILMCLLPSLPLEHPREITGREFATTLWSTHGFVTILLSILVFTIIASALAIVVYAIHSK